jgi:hypothetical protein
MQIDGNWQILILMVFVTLASGCGKKLESKKRESDAPVPSGGNANVLTLDLKAHPHFAPSAELRAKGVEDPAYMLEWMRSTVIGDYKSAGMTNQAWNDAAIKAFETFALLRSLKEVSQEQEAELSSNLKKAIKTAIDAGCPDPMVNYLHTRTILSRTEGMTYEMLATRFTDISEQIETTRYAPILKMYAALRAVQYWKGSMKDGETNILPRLYDLRMRTVQHLAESLDDTNLPPLEATIASREVWSAVEPSSHARRFFNEKAIGKLDEHWSGHGFASALKAEYHIKKAWESRGTGWANTVTPEGWKGMKEHLDIAEAVLRKGWSLDQKDVQIPIKMITICMGQGLPREEMEKWFDRAMEIDPGSSDAAYAKLSFLEPKWQGSAEDMLEFGRECVASTKWRGIVPLVLRDAHDRLSNYLDKEKRGDYWLSSRVWKDVQQSYDRYFELNPGDISYRHNYALDAYKCREYPAFLRQLTYFQGTNYAFFGGKEAFEKMVKTAKN